MGVDRAHHYDSQPTDEVARALVGAVGVDPAHLVVGSVRLTPWNSHHTAMLNFEVVYILDGSPAEVQALLETGQELGQVQW